MASEAGVGGQGLRGSPSLGLICRRKVEDSDRGTVRWGKMEVGKSSGQQGDRESCESSIFIPNQAQAQVSLSRTVAAHPPP